MFMHYKQLDVSIGLMYQQCSKNPSYGCSQITSSILNVSNARVSVPYSLPWDENVFKK